MKQNSAKPGREPTGLVALRVTTIDQVDRPVLDFYRCAMLPLSPDAPDTGHADDLSVIGTGLAAPADVTSHWDAEEFRRRVPGPHFGHAEAGVKGAVLTSSADVVTSAPELARLTLNIAATHHDSRVAGQRLVYGGHTIGLALAQACRLLPNLVTVLGWQSCDHTGPVHEGDTLYSELHVESATDNVLGLRSLVYAAGVADDAERQVLDWRFTALQF
jgi:acyl dehydratase